MSTVRQRGIRAAVTALREVVVMVDLPFVWDERGRRLRRH
jgi:hypothetical protein